MNRKRMVVRLFAVITVVCLIGFLWWNNTANPKHTLDKLGYQQESIVKLVALGLENKLEKQPYSAFVDHHITNPDFNLSNIDIYLSLPNQTYKTYLNDVNQLIVQAYDAKAIKLICAQNEDTIKTLVGKTKIEHIEDYLVVGIFLGDNLDRYLTYASDNQGKDAETVVKEVNMNLDYDFYSHVKTIQNPSSRTALVNKYNRLPDNYVPDNLVTLSTECASRNTVQMQKEAALAFEKMCQAIKQENGIILGTSGYRSYATQKSLYDSYTARDGKAAADTYSARPRFSEHETGLAIDVQSGTKNYLKFGDTEEYQWVLKNAYRYGFFVHYQEGKEEITGYSTEPWHLRYVGVDVATALHLSGLTYDEYYVMNQMTK